jgi:hypothetical protein
MTKSQFEFDEIDEFYRFFRVLSNFPVLRRQSAIGFMQALGPSIRLLIGRPAARGAYRVIRVNSRANTSL